MSATRAMWVLQGQDGLDSLQLVENAELPEVGQDDVLVRLHAASLNYREVVVAKGSYGTKARDRVVPGSDGAGVIEAVGTGVSGLQPGDKVCTHLVAHKPDDHEATFSDIRDGLGESLDGTLCTRGIFHQSNIVKMPSNLNFLEAATLTCSGLTAWNALFGLEGKALKKGQTVLIQGTGGVSIAALQFAVALGATVIATTSSNDKIARLKKLGAHHVINYQLTPDWGLVAKRLTLDGTGVDLVVDVGGSATLNQSILAVKPNGLIALAGVLGGPPDPYAPNVPNLMAGIMHTFTGRGFLLGSRDQFNAMNRFVQASDVKPALDERIFELSELKDAYQYMERQGHFSKIAIWI